jgi:hypothetical protein
MDIICIPPAIKAKPEIVCFDFLGPRPCVLCHLDFQFPKSIYRRLQIPFFDFTCLDSLSTRINPYQLCLCGSPQPMDQPLSMRVRIAFCCGSTPLIFDCVDRQVLWINRLFFRQDFNLCDFQYRSLFNALMPSGPISAQSRLVRHFTSTTVAFFPEWRV